MILAGLAKKKRAGALASTVALVLCGITLGAYAAPTAEQIQEYQSANDADRIRLLITLAKSGQPDLAEELLSAFPLQGDFATNRELYVRGLIKRAQGDNAGAAASFRQALANDPKLTLVRQDLAETLVALEEDDSAVHHLKLLQAEAPDAVSASRLAAFIDQIDQRRPYRFNAYLSAAPTTNVNSGSIRKTVFSPLLGGEGEIDKSFRRKSALGVAAGADAYYAKPLGEDWTAIFAGGVDARIYNQRIYNAATVSESFELRHSIEGGYWGVGAVASQALGDADLKTKDYAPNYMSYGPRVTARYSLSPQDTISATAVFEWRDYKHDTSQDGHAILFDTSWQHAIDSTFNTTASAGFDRVKAEDGTKGYTAFSGGLSAYKELEHGITLELGGELQSSDFDDVTLFAGKIRQDLRLTGRLSVTKRDLNWFGFAPSVDYSYTWNDSNISLWDFDVHTLDLRLTKEF
jgi:outer membrane protein